MGPITHFSKTETLQRETESLHCELGGTDRSLRWDQNVTKGKQGVYIAISVGPIAHLGKTEMLQRETERLQSHLGETEIPIGETELIRVSGYGYVKWTRWRRIYQIGGAEFDFRFRTYVDVGK